MRVATVARRLLGAALLTGSAVYAQSSATTTGTCSPSFSQVAVSGDIKIQIECGGDRRALDRLAADVTKFLRSARLNQEQVTVVLGAFNGLLPGLITQLDRLEGKQDIAVDGIQELLRRTVSRQSTPDEIERGLSVVRFKLLAGTELSECKCWGWMSGSEYGKRLRNPSCLSEMEERVACRSIGQNVCTGDYRPYEPWQRICR